MTEYIMGNGAIAMGALKAGVSFAAGYPGTPSSEIIETIYKRKHEGAYHVGWEPWLWAKDRIAVIHQHVDLCQIHGENLADGVP